MIPKISIIVPCYNQAQFLDECLQSVLDQTYQDWECIIVNDGSTDDTAAVAKKWLEKDVRFKYISIANSGVSNARNVGIKQARGAYTQFVDSDDILNINKLTKQIQFFASNPEVDIVYGSSRYFFEFDKEELYAIHYNSIIPTIELSKNDKNQTEVLLIRNICTNCAPLYKKKVFNSIQFKNLPFEDWFLHLECSLNGFKFHFLTNDEPDCLIRMTKSSQMNIHTENHKLSKEFDDSFQTLISSHRFTSKLLIIDNKPIVKNKQPKNLISKYFKMLIPPLFLLLISKFKQISNG